MTTTQDLKVNCDSCTLILNQVMVRLQELKGKVIETKTYPKDDFCSLTTILYNLSKELHVMNAKVRYKTSI